MTDTEPDLHAAAPQQADARPKTIGLSMIVKNETKVIRRCLESALPLADYILVVDTGSTDGTQQVIRDFLAQRRVRGAVIDEPWRDFAYNRTFALERLREVEDIDYALIIDADDTIELEPGFDPKALKAGMTHDLYDVPIRYASLAYARAQICSNRLAFTFKGVLHEYLEGPPVPLTRATVTGFSMRASTQGARSGNPRKYQDDAALLERTLATETDPFLISRYTFYLAQSYRDSREHEKALENYLKRAALGFWREEVYISLLEAGNLMSALDRPFDEVIATYERAAQTVPKRGEALCQAANYCRKHGKNAEGQAFARRGIALALPPNGLFLQPWVYEYGLLDEFAINAYWAGAYCDSLDASLKLIASEKLPPTMVKRIAANARFAAGKIPVTKPPEPAVFGAEGFVQQHKLAPARPLGSRVGLVPDRASRSKAKKEPRVLVAILAKQKEEALPLYLDCIEALDYPKSSITLHIRTNNNTDRTEQILRDWVDRVGPLYHKVEFDASDVAERVEQFREHEWNATRFSVLGRIRGDSMQRALDLGCEYYFVADIDNFVRRDTLRELVALDLPIVAPLLRVISPTGFYSNYHADIDAHGYMKPCDQYYWILSRQVRGIVEVPVVHCTYLVRADMIPKLTYDDKSARYEYVVFAASARQAGIPQYLDNRQVYGYITFGKGAEHHVEGGIEQARTLLARADGTVGLETASPVLSPSTASRPKTLVFCTSFCSTQQRWDVRYRRWLNAIRGSGLQFDQILIVDDGSRTLPQWDDLDIIKENAELAPSKPTTLYHFADNLGRRSTYDFPGWYRSFAFAATFATANAFEKIVHVESDAFLITPRIVDYINGVNDGWHAFWCKCHNMPEAAIQVIAGKEVASLRATTMRPHSDFAGKLFEKELPFTHVEKSFEGDRYGEYADRIPRAADYVTQTVETAPDAYYWWLNENLPAADNAVMRDEQYYFLYCDGKHMERNRRDTDETLATYLRAAEMAPHRVEALHAASKLCFDTHRNEQGYKIAKRGIGVPAPTIGIEVEPWIYEYGLLDVFSINAYWAGYYEESLQACERLLRERKIPDQMRDRIETNARSAFAKMAKSA